MFYTKPWADALIVLLVVLLFFGPKRLPALGRSLGDGMREFKDSITGKSKGDEAEPAALGDSTQAEPTATVPASESTPVASPEPRA